MAILRALAKSAAEKAPAALQLLGMLPDVDTLLADVQAAPTRRN